MDSIGDQVGLGRHWTPLQVAHETWRTLRVGGERYYVCRAETPLGVLGIAYDERGARAHRDALDTLLGGIIPVHNAAAVRSIEKGET